jgi:hypothetical protein
LIATCTAASLGCEANIGAETARLDEPLRRIVARLAEGLKRPEPELVHVTMMRLDVITDLGRGDDAAFEAVLAQGMLEQLVPSNSSPAWRAVPLIPLRWSTANTHGSN